MQVPFTDPVTAFLLFVQSLFLYLHYGTTGFFAGDHWGFYLLPTFIGLIFLVAVLATQALFEGRSRVVRGLNEAQADMSAVLIQMLATVMLLLTLVLFVFYLDEDTDLPLYWITTSLFGTSVLFFIASIFMYIKALRPIPGCKSTKISWAYVFVGFLAFAQGLFLWLYNSPWGRVMDVAVWIVAIPGFVFLLASFYRTLMQTYQKRTDPGPHMVRQFAFLFLILVACYAILTIVIHLSDPDITWTKPRWTCLIVMIYSILLVVAAVYVYAITKGITLPILREDLAYEKKTTPVYGITLHYADQKKAETFTEHVVDNQQDQFLVAYQTTARHY
jgi:hypothetical protein